MKSHLLHNFIIFAPCPPHFYCFPSSLIWTRAFRLVNAQSVQFSKITKKLKIDLCQFFSHWKEELFLLKSGNKKWGSPYSFLRRSCRKCAPHSFSPILERGLGRVSQYHVCKHVCGRGKKALNDLFFQNLQGDITVRTQCANISNTLHESHLGKNQPQPKILIAFLSSQLHFNNVTLDALYHGGHLVMRSKRCAVQNHRITLITESCIITEPRQLA